MPLRSDLKYTWSERVFEPIITIRCRRISAELDKQKFGSGSRGKCIRYKDEWLTPSEFETQCGLTGSRDWKRSLHCEGRKLQCLIEDGILRLHSKACLCSHCCNDKSSDQPVKYFIQPKRKVQKMQLNIKKLKAKSNSAGTKAVINPKKNCPDFPFDSSENLCLSPLKQPSLESFAECLDGIMLKIEELKNVVRDLKVEFCKKLIDNRQEMEKEKQKEIEAIQIKAKLMMDKKVAEEKQLMDIQLQEALAQIRQELMEQFSKSK